jgi:hypothetical protein
MSFSNLLNPAFPAASLPTSLGEEEGKACRNRLFGLARDIRVDCQNLGTALTSLQEAIEARASTKQDVDRELKMFRMVLKRCEDQIANRAAEIHKLLEIDPETYDAVGDEIAQICNTWETVSYLCSELHSSTALQKPAIDPADVPALSAQIKRVREPLHQILKIAGYLTIPHRLNHHLEETPRGRPVKFREVFADELEQGDLDALFQQISNYGLLFDGLLDPSTGFVYSASRKPWRRKLSAIQAFALLVLPAVALAIGQPGGWKLWTKVYLAAGAGLLLHFVLGAIKQSRNDKAVSSPLMDWALWIHVKSFQVTLTILSLWGAVCGLYLLQKGTFDAAKIETWLPLSLALGYSLDSIVDLFIQRFDSVMEKQTAILKKALQPDARSPQPPVQTQATAAAGATHG